jgi:deoxyribodipyrimidine photo-lyase
LLSSGIAKRDRLGFLARVSLRPTIVWFRQDLRLQDNPALAAAVARRAPILPLHVLDDEGEAPWTPGGASRSWLHHSLASLAASLQKYGSKLILRRGSAGDVLTQLAKETGAEAVYWNRRYEPAARAVEEVIERELTAQGLEVRTFTSALLFEPDGIRNKQGRPFQVFTPFWRHCTKLPVPEEIVFRGRTLPAPGRFPKSLQLDVLGLRPVIPWDSGFYEQWQPGEPGAHAQLERFVSEAVTGYGKTRNLPDQVGTSRLSPHLHFGEISPRQVCAAVQAAVGNSSATLDQGSETFLAEIGWREFAYHLLYHFPGTHSRPLRKEFESFPWAPDPRGKRLRAWQRGQTGYPIVDAGMRELWHTGWMHNRVRMIVASFLVKHLRLDWFHGATWFWDTLVDADLANNTLGWQWSAGCGADAAPYFRIFAPVLQGEKFDAEGAYVRRWIPELARLSPRFIHQPWSAPQKELTAAGVALGRTYPRPIVDHQLAREEALAAFREFRRKGAANRAGLD